MNLDHGVTFSASTDSIRGLNIENGIPVKTKLNTK